MDDNDDVDDDDNNDDNNNTGTSSTSRSRGIHSRMSRRFSHWVTGNSLARIQQTQTGNYAHSRNSWARTPQNA